jgi:Helix-turn-helix domain
MKSCCEVETFRPQTRYYFMPLPAPIARDLKLKSEDKLLYSAIAYHQGRDSVCFATIETLAREIGLPKRTTERSLARLKQMKHLVAIRRGLGDSNEYRILPHPCYTDADLRSDVARVPDPPVASLPGVSGYATTGGDDTPPQADLDTPRAAYITETPNRTVIKDQSNRGDRSIDHTPTTPADSMLQVDEFFEQRYARHPKKGHKALAMEKIRSIPGIASARIQYEFAESHERWIYSEGWQWRAGAQAPMFHQFVVDGMWKHEPTPFTPTPFIRDPPQTKAAAAADAARKYFEAQEQIRRPN